MGQLSVARSMLVVVGVSACSIAPVTFTLPEDAPTDTMEAGADAPADAAVAPPSCNAIHVTQPTLPSGEYQVDPDGAGGDPPVTVACDMTTDGGGWTIVFLAPTTKLMTLPIPYTGGTPRLMADAQSVLLAYRNAAQTSYPDHARLDLPPPWRTTPPFNVDGTDLMTSVSINGGGPTVATLRYGKDTFSMTCSDGWITTVQWGRICIIGTRAPFFNGFSHAVDDYCSDSLSTFPSTFCRDDLRFSIAVR